MSGELDDISVTSVVTTVEFKFSRAYTVTLSCIPSVVTTVEFKCDTLALAGSVKFASVVTTVEFKCRIAIANY